MASPQSQSALRLEGLETRPTSGETYTVDDNAPSHAGNRTNDTNDNANNDDDDDDDDGIGERAGQAFDLASMRTLLPRQNFSAHPNIKLLPGLDFGIPETAPFTSQQMSGLVAKILLPSKAAGEPPSTAGQFDVATRISQVIVAAADVYHTCDVYTLRIVFEYAFKNLRDKGRTWDFESATRKSFPIMEKILEARKRFIANERDTSKIELSFLHFLKALDDFILIVEGGLKTKKLKTTGPATLLNTNRKRTGNHLPNRVAVPWKVRRSLHDDGTETTETAEQPLDDDEVATWRAKCKSLEASLAQANKEATEAKEALSRDHEQWSQRMKQLWAEVRPAVNEYHNKGCDEEWKEDDFDSFLWESGLDEVRRAVFDRK